MHKTSKQIPLKNLKTERPLVLPVLTRSLVQYDMLVVNGASLLLDLSFPLGLLLADAVDHIRPGRLSRALALINTTELALATVLIKATKDKQVK